jgi:TfoX/Sxy family transcriptional regulator of competence genes
MSFDEKLAARIRERWDGRSDVTERKMFGGLAFLIRGHMCCGIIGSDLMVRVGHDDFERMVAEPHARPMDFTGRPSRGMVYVSLAGVRTTRSLSTWLDRGLRFISTLPPKSAGAAGASRRARTWRTR